MINFHGTGKAAAFFEGWYFKHQKGAHTIAFIPGLQVDARGHRSAFVQIITEKGSWLADYPASDFRASTDQLAIRVGKNLFTPVGARIEIHNALVSCKGVINYGPFVPPKYDAMGPFQLVPSMECKHGVISLFHKLGGSVELNGEAILLDGGVGYIEKDWGTSFPRNYLWAQSSDFGGRRCSVMATAAEVPFGEHCIRGCIAMVWFRGREYRLATYTGAKAVAFGPRSLVLRQGNRRLDVLLCGMASQKLLAPSSGRLERVIRENASSEVRFRFSQGEHILFDAISPHASYEFVEK